MGELVHNERVKLTANVLNSASTACLTVGAIAPLAALIYASGTMTLSLSFFVIAGLSWLLAAAALHLFARETLGGLHE
jgi:hypothetical protein